MHDEVYRVLRSAGDWRTASQIKQGLGGSLGLEEIAKRIETLGLDFVIETRHRGGRPSWRLGEFKAFRGQLDHERHLAFSEQRTRGRIS
jgi:DNA (cytosine-5)-methyltransferase 1